MSFNKNKADSELGKQVHEYLVKMGVETPTNPNGLSRTDKIDIIEAKFTDIMNALGLDLSDDSLIETPKRVAKMMVGEIFWGLDYEAFPKCTTVDNKMQYNEMVVERNVNVQSNCEHHFVVIDGLATVAYVPKQKVIDAQHYCVKSRGVEDTGSSTVTCRLGGGFKTDPSARQEFLQIANKGCK